MRIKLDIIINGDIHLYLPAEGINIQVQRNEYNLLTTDRAQARPLYITQTFNLPLDGNLQIFQNLEGVEKKCQLLYNDVIVIYGNLVEYSIDNQQRVITVSIVSAFKDMVDYMGDNVLYLDKIDLEEYNYIVPEEFNASLDTDMLSFGYYNPMDTNTGQLQFSQSNINDFCKPSLNILNYFKKIFQLNKWDADWDSLPEGFKNLRLLPTEPYRCASFVLGENNAEYIIQPGERLYMNLGADNCLFNSVKNGVKAIDYPGTPSMGLVGEMYLTDVIMNATVSRTELIGLGQEDAIAAGYGVFTDSQALEVLNANKNKTLLLKGKFKPSQAGGISFGFYVTDYDEGVFGGSVLLDGGVWNDVEIEIEFTPTVSSITSYGHVIFLEPNINTATLEYKEIGLYDPATAKSSTPIPMNDEEITAVQIRQPNRLQSFKLKALYECPDPVVFGIEEQGQPDLLLNVLSLGDSVINQVTDSINTKEGLNPLSVFLENPNNYPISVKIEKWRFYNLFNIYETNQDEYITPVDFMYPVVDNYPNITPLELYRELLILFQIAQHSDDVIKKVSFYEINRVLRKQQQFVEIDRYIQWNGYETIGTPEGLNKLNLIRYKDDVKRQQYFKIKLPQLPANGIYFESIFSHCELNNPWSALTLPALKYKVKKVDDVSVEYLEWSDINPAIGMYNPNGVNIIKPSLIQPQPEIKLTVNNYEYKAEANNLHNAGIFLNYEIWLNEGKPNFVFSYKIKYESGDLLNLGGHFLGTISKWYFDGVLQTKTYQNAIPFPQDHEWHDVIIYVSSFPTNPSLNRNLYIQGNRATVEKKNFVFSVKNIKITMGDVLYPWSPYGVNGMQFNNLVMTNVVKKYWNNILTFLSSNQLQNPNVFKATLRMSYYQYYNLMKQSNLFFYNGDAVLIDGEYDVLNQTFVGTFINLK